MTLKCSFLELVSLLQHMLMIIDIISFATPMPPGHQPWKLANFLRWHHAMRWTGLRIQAWLFWWECTYLSAQWCCRSENCWGFWASALFQLIRIRPLVFAPFASQTSAWSCFCNVLGVNLLKTFTNSWRPFHPCSHAVKWDYSGSSDSLLLSWKGQICPVFACFTFRSINK